MERERPPSPARSGSTAGVAARAILASSTAPGMRDAAGAAKVGLALTRRPGHVVVTGPDGGIAAALVRATELQLDGMRLVREAGADVEVDRLLGALGGASPGERAAAVVTNADALSASSLERLHAGLDAAALERGDVRLVLIGGPELRRTLRDARLGDLMAHVCLQLDLPGEDAVAPGEPDHVEPVGSNTRLRAGGIAWIELIGLAAVIVVGVLLWTRLDSEPIRIPQQPEIVPTRQLEDATPVPIASPPASDRESVAAPNEAPATPGEQAPVIAVPPLDAVPAVEALPAVEEPRAVDAVPVVEVPVRRAAPLAPGSSLQVGAFANADNASHLAARLRPLFDRVEVTKVVRGTRTLHRVRIVGFTSETARRSAVRRLAAEGIEALPVR